MAENNPFDWLTNSLPKAGEAPEADTHSEALNAAAEAEYQDRVMLARWVSEGVGPLALDWLQQHTIEMPLITGRSMDQDNLGIGLTPSDWAYRRDGQNSIVRFLKDNLKWIADYEARKQAAMEGEDGES